MGKQGLFFPLFFIIVKSCRTASRQASYSDNNLLSLYPSLGNFLLLFFSLSLKFLLDVCVCVCVCAHAQLCPVLCSPKGCSLPGSSVVEFFR